jgi:hypothetical protein
MHRLRVLLLKEGDQWVAQALEYDIAAQAGTIRDVMYEFERTLVCELVACSELGHKPFEDIPQAPRYYHELFEEAAEPVSISERPSFRLPAEVPEAYMLPQQQEVRVY